MDLVKRGLVNVRRFFGPLLLVTALWQCLDKVLPASVAKPLGYFAWPLQVSYAAALIGFPSARPAAGRLLGWLAVVCVPAALFASFFLGPVYLPFPLRLPWMMISFLAFLITILAPGLALETGPLTALRDSARMFIQRPARLLILLASVYVPLMALLSWLVAGAPYQQAEPSYRILGILIYAVAFGLAGLPSLGVVMALLSERTAGARPVDSRSWIVDMLRQVSGVVLGGVLGGLANLVLIKELPSRTLGLGYFSWIPSHLGRFLPFSVVDLAVVALSCGVAGWVSERISGNRRLAAPAGILCGILRFEMMDGQHFGQSWILGGGFSFFDAALYIVGMLFRGGLSLGAGEISRRARRR